MNLPQMWSIYYASVVSMQFHPGNAGKRLSLEECADIADAMAFISVRRFKEPPSWHGSELQ